MGTLKDLLSDEVQKLLAASSANEGEVFRMHLGEEEQVIGKNQGDEGRNKYFVVIGHDSEGNALGFVLINSAINPALPQKRKDMHYPILAANYDFLEGKNRFVDCSDFKRISKKKFAELFGNGTCKGSLNTTDLACIKEAVATYEDASPKLLKRFGLRK